MTNAQRVPETYQEIILYGEIVVSRDFAIDEGRRYLILRASSALSGLEYYAWLEPPGVYGKYLGRWNDLLEKREQSTRCRWLYRKRTRHGRRRISALNRIIENKEEVLRKIALIKIANTLPDMFGEIR